MVKHYVVLEDPNGTYWPGALIESERRANMLRSDGVVLLQCEPLLFSRSGVGGFYKRAWGSGIPLSNLQPKMIVPMTIFVSREFQQLHWCVRLVKDDELKHIEQFNGLLRLSADNSQPGAHVSGLGQPKKAIALDDLGAPDANNGWTVFGMNEVRPDADGLMGLSFYGMAPGLRLVWAAISQCGN